MVAFATDLVRKRLSPWQLGVTGDRRAASGRNRQSAEHVEVRRCGVPPTGQEDGQGVHTRTCTPRSGGVG